MKVLAVLALCVAAASAAVLIKEEKLKKPIPIVKYILNDDNMGNFAMEAVSANGSIEKEEGHLKDLGDKEGPVTVMSGSFSFIGDDGRTYTVNWIADEGGFRASGDHLPTPPPIPAEILKTL